MIQKFVWLAIAGGLGTLARYGLAGFVHKINGESIPWGTAIVNLTGCFVAGMIWMLFENRWTVSTEVRTLVLVGFMGSFMYSSNDKDGGQYHDQDSNPMTGSVFHRLFQQ